ncbi:extracellular solute-binding protein [Parapusillimonas sp. SGNA-6]|jgi:putative spermidine/putrescine transport system substrate-binding protein|nr:extracellular solute-binding protein [Parapusillimonas sp. SGNA-6]
MEMRKFDKLGAPQRRRLLKALSIAGLGGPLASLQAFSPAHAAKPFVFGTTGGKFHEGTKEVFVENTGFRKRNSLELVYDIQNDSGIAAKVLASCGRPMYDIAQAVESNAARASLSGCLMDYDPSKVPNLADIPETYRLSGYYASAMTLLNGLVYNTKYVKQPTSWEDLMNPKYKGKVAIPAFGWIGQQFLHAINKAFGGNEDNIDPGIAALSEIVGKNEAVIVSGSNPADMLFQREEIWLMPFWNGRMLNLRKGGVPVDIYYQPHFLQVGTGYIIPKGTANAELAQELVNITLDPEVQLELVRYFEYAPTNKKVKVPAELAPVVLPDYAVDRGAQIEWTKLVEYVGRDSERWNKEVLRT